MEIGGLKRSEISFRRQGSSGLIWDDKFLSGDLNRMMAHHEQEGKEKVDLRELRPSRSVGSTGALRGRHSPKEQTYRTVKASSPNVDPPSPKVSGCGFCRVFGKPQHPPPAKHSKRKARKH